MAAGLPDDVSSPAPPAPPGRLFVDRTVVPVLAVLGAFAMPAVSALGPRFSAAGAFAVTSSVLLVVGFRRARQSFPGAGAVAAMHALVWACLLFHGARHALQRSLVHMPGGSLESARGEGVPELWILLTGAVIALHVAAASRPGMRVYLDAGLRWLALGATCLAVVAAGLAVASGARRPDPDALFATFPKLGELRPGEEGSFLGRRILLAPRREVRGAGDEEATEHPFVDPDSCKIMGIPYDDESHRPIDCSAATFRLDPRHTHVIVERASGTRDAFVLPSWEHVAMRPTEMVSRVSPPIGWTTAGVVTAPLAVVLWVLAVRGRRRARAMERSGFDGVEEGFHLGDGAVLLFEERAAQVPAAAPLGRRRVLLRGPSMQRASYRQPETLTFASVEVGTVEDLRLRAQGLVASYDGLAAGVACLGVAPLVACVVVGILR